MATVPKAFESGLGQQTTDGARSPFQRTSAPISAFQSGGTDGLADLGNAASQMALRVKAQNDEAALNALQTELDDWETTNVVDAQSGVFSRKGNIAGITGETNGLFSEAFGDNRLQDFDGESLEQARALIQRKRNQITRSVTRYEAREVDAYQTSQFRAVVEGAELASQTFFNDPERLTEEFMLVRDAIAGRVAAGQMSGEEGDVAAKQFRQAQLLGAGESWVRHDLQGARRFLDENRDELGAANTARLEDKIGREQRAREAQWRAQVARTQSIAAAELDVAIQEGRAGQDDIDAAYENGTISPSAWASRRRQLEAADEKAAKEREPFEMLELGAPLDPSNKDHRDAVGDLFETGGGREAVIGLTPEGATFATGLAAESGIVPDDVIGFVRGAIASGTDQQRQYAYDLIGRLDEEAPDALKRALNTSELSEAATYLKLTTAGMADNQAMETISANRALDDEGRAKRRTAAAKLFEDIHITSEFFDPGYFVWEPDMPEFVPLSDSIASDAQAVFIETYVRTGDEDVAKAATSDVLNKTYGPSEVTGSRTLTQYPPENFYSIPGIDNDWMEQQLREDVLAINPDAEGQRIEVVPTPRTAADVQAGRPPRYQVLVQDENGVFEPVLDENNNVMDYRWDPTPIVERRKAELTETREVIVESEQRAPHTLLRRAMGLDAPTADDPSRIRRALHLPDPDSDFEIPAKPLAEDTIAATPEIGLGVEGNN